jgi:hypothetical protein
MNQPTLLSKLLSPAGFGLVLLLFFLPFVAVACGPDEHRVTATFSGVAMVTGAAPVYTGPDIKPGEESDIESLFADQYDNEPLVLFAAAVILGGMATAFIRDRRGRFGAGVGFAGLATALLLAGEIRAIGRLNHIQIRDQVGQLTDLSPVNATPRIGFYLAMGVLVVLIAAHAVVLFRRPVSTGPPTQPPRRFRSPGGRPGFDAPPFDAPEYNAPEYDEPHDDSQWAPIWAGQNDGDETTVRDAYPLTPPPGPLKAPGPPHQPGPPYS